MIPTNTPKWKQELEFLTPCFCGGADSNIAELRIPSLRGVLRWWLRCLGASRAQEMSLLGGMAPNIKASAIMLRLLDASQPLSPVPWNFGINHNKNEKRPQASVDYFLTAQNRISTRSYLPVGYRFTLQMCQVHPIKDVEEGSALALLEHAWRCMGSLGSIGSRTSRGYGAMAPVDAVDVETVLNSLPKAFSYRLTGNFPANGEREDIIEMIGSEIQKYRETEGMGSGKNTILGSAQPLQASAVRYRPIRMSDGSLKLLVLRVPDLVLYNPVEARKNSRPLQDWIDTSPTA